MNKVLTMLAYNKEAEEAVRFYVATFNEIFGDSKIKCITYWSSEEIKEIKKMPGLTRDMIPGPAGIVKTMCFTLKGQEFMAMNGGGYFGKFTESASIYINCETQDEIDFLWDRLSEGGLQQDCGWVKDRYGVSWQIIPSIIQEIDEGPDKEKSLRVFKAMMKMKKIDIEEIMLVNKK
jgi:predicted 3-demethylubiquinone-9 3-methyltransferase (glyoxalase superfamily)